MAAGAGARTPRAPDGRDSDPSCCYPRSSRTNSQKKLMPVRFGAPLRRDDDFAALDGVGERRIRRVVDEAPVDFPVRLELADLARRVTLGAEPYSRTRLRRGGTDTATIAERGAAAASRVHVRLILVRHAVDPVELFQFLCVDD